MEKKYLNEFVSLFKYLSDAAGIIEDNYNPDDVPSEYREGYNKLKELQIKKIRETNSLVLEISHNINRGLMPSLVNELESNLYKYPDSRESYIKSIIRQFTDILPYFNIPNMSQLWDLSFDWANGSIEIDNKTYGRWINYIFRIQLEYFKVKREKFTVEEYYIIYSRKLLDLFCISLDTKCLDFDIDIMKFQEDLNIYLFRWRDVPHKTQLYDLGYREKLNQISTVSTDVSQKPVELNTDFANIQASKESKPALIEINNYFKFKHHKKGIIIRDYLDEIKRDILTPPTGGEPMKKTIGNVCLTLYKRNLHDINRVKTFAFFAKTLCEYWNIGTPKDLKPNKYEILNNYSILERNLE
ncbi:hypothetical protein CLV62_12220 [Dysgonomonas alginatilytica]|uniref:Uncharacterized protein n=1 Tax=Dysgonomonas alginatilytica TaxID=1605892 RepID=A0A2V3PN27_9BACT|nr:hypothetical protein [Dysgonomonas alginatilytica]PXV62067.1 hypothetical protein CLV62_12220 [Dysgonomonas alginatilytica]